MNLDYNCFITPSMWHQTFGPHELVRMQGTIKGHKVHILIDDGASHNFLNYTLVKELKLLQTPSTHSYKVGQIFIKIMGYLCVQSSP